MDRTHFEQKIDQVLERTAADARRRAMALFDSGTTEAQHFADDETLPKLVLYVVFNELREVYAPTTTDHRKLVEKLENL